MAGEAIERKVIPFPASLPARRHAPVGDLRFRALLGEREWERLPEAVRARFSKRIANCHTAVYCGEVVECRMNRAGRLLALLARIVGAPLPLSTDALVPAKVCVSEDFAGGGQFWTRIYGRRRGFPQAIRSIKRFCGPTGLEEYLGGGLGIALSAEADAQAIHFISDHYFLRIGRLRLRLPHWLEPGAMRVSHVDCGHGSFAFVLVVRHPLFGELVHQTAMFADTPAPEPER